MRMGGVKALLRVTVGPWLGGETRRGRLLPNLLETAFNTSGTSSAQGLSSKYQLRKQFWDSPSHLISQAARHPGEEKVSIPVRNRLCYPNNLMPQNLSRRNNIAYNCCGLSLSKNPVIFKKWYWNKGGCYRIKYDYIWIATSLLQQEKF